MSTAKASERPPGVGRTRLLALYFLVLGLLFALPVLDSGNWMASANVFFAAAFTWLVLRSPSMRR